MGVLLKIHVQYMLWMSTLVVLSNGLDYEHENNNSNNNNNNNKSLKC